MATQDEFWAKDVQSARAKAAPGEQKATADIGQSEASAAASRATAGRTTALLPGELAAQQAALAKTAEEARKAKLEADEAERLARRPKPPSEAEAAQARVSGDMEAAIQTINVLTRGFNRNLAGQGLVQSTLEYFPSQEKGAINATGAGLADVGLALFKVPGAGAQSDKDAARFVAANQPSTWDKDYEFLGKVYNLRRRLDAKAKSMGLPPIQWEEPVDIAAQQFFAIPEAERSKIGARAVGSFGDVPPELVAPAAAPAAPGVDVTPAEASAMNAAMNVATPLVAAGMGAGEKSIPIPAEMQAEMQDWFAKHPRGSASLKEYSDFRRGLDMKYGFSVGDYENDPQSIEWLNYYNDPKRPVNTAIPPVVAEDTRNALERVAGAAVMSAPGTAATTALSGTGLNVLDVVLPEQMQAVRELNPASAALGDIGGALTGSALLKKAGTKLAQTALSRAPKAYSALMSSGKGATAARNLLSDVAQGAIYGGAVEGDAGMGAAAGGFGNVLGLTGGAAVKRLLGGFARSPEAEALMRNYGLEDLTVGQQAGGGFRAVEDTATSVPGIGDIINARRGESLLGLNEAAFREVAGEPVGLGKPGLDAIKQARKRAYDDALAGKYFDLNNPAFTSEMSQALAQRSKLTDELAGDFDVAVRRSLAETPIGRTGGMTGEHYQQAQRRLSKYKAAHQKEGFEQDYRDALGEVGKALRAEVERQSPELVPLLSEADYMYRGEKLLQDAIARARKDTTGLGGDVFTPGQLTDAVYQSGKKYPGTPPLQELARAAQNVIPSKLPDSGSAKRGALTALGTVGLGGLAGGGYGLATDSETPLEDAASTAAYPAAVIAALTAGGSRRGQRVLSKMLFDRPQLLKTTGDLVRKYAPAVGTASIPGLVPDTRYPAQVAPQQEAGAPPALAGLPAGMDVRAAPKQSTIEIGGRKVRYDAKTDKYYDVETGEVVPGLAVGGRARRRLAVAR